MIIIIDMMVSWLSVGDILEASSWLLTFFLLTLQNQNSSVKINNVVNSSSYKEQIQRSKDEMHFMKQRNDAYNMTKYIANQQKQQRMPSEVSHHHPLARTVSTPMPVPDANQAVSNLFSSLNDILNAGATVVGTGHRKLERTQSEPLPQTNTSRWVELATVRLTLSQLWVILAVAK